MPTLTANERIGTLVGGGRYNIRRVIGEGGFSSVFEAVHTVTGREVALKLLHGHLVATGQVSERFLNEARAMARIRHDGIVQVFDAGRDPDGTVFIALELLEGETLEGTLGRVGRLTWGETVAIGADVLEALGEAHRHEIIHRDIKPGNIFIVRKPDGSSQAKLLDFGIAHVAQMREGRLTERGMILGTPEYMSPEQGRSGDVGPASDLWSVGIVLFECLTGNTPFVGESATEVLLKVASDPVPTLREADSSVPAPIAAVIDRALARNLEVRYASAETMRDALVAARSGVDALHAATSRLRGPTLPAARRPVPIGAPPRRPPPATITEVVVSTGAVPAPVPGTPLRAPPPAIGSHPGNTAASPMGPSPSVALVPRSNAAVEREPVDGVRRNTSGVRPREMDPPERPSPERLSGERPSAERLSGERAAPEPVSPAAAGVPSSERPSPVPRDRSSYDPGRGVTTFEAPPGPSRASILALGGAAGLVALAGVGYFLAAHSEQTPSSTQPSTSHPAADPADPAEPARTPAAPGNLTVQSAVTVPQALAGADNAAEFARHAVVSPGAGTTQRVLATCVPGVDGGAVAYLFSLAGGAQLASSRGEVACAGFDLAVVPDMTGDGTDDVVAVAPGGASLVVLDSRTLRAWRTVALPGVRGVVGGLNLRGDPAVVAYTEAAGSGPSAVVAVSLTSQNVLWRVQGAAPLGRVGDPMSLGLSVGPDATGDGVADVAMGAGTLEGVATGRSRCVLLVSGVDGRPTWPAPFCQGASSGPQAVSLGPDVNGDGRGDVAVGSDGAAAGEPRVVLVSGANAQVLRAVPAPEGEGASGFGWPVALGGDFDGDGTPDLLVGSVGDGTFATLFDATTARRVAQVAIGGVGTGYLRLYAVEPSVVRGRWSALVAAPAGGIRIYSVPAAPGP